MPRRISRVARSVAALAWVLALNAALQSNGCTVDERHPDVDPGGIGGGAGMGGSVGMGSAGMGSAGMGSAGSPGSPTQRCAAEDPSCTQLPLQNCGLSCPEVRCPADDACKDYIDLLSQGSCSSAGGVCASVADCSFRWKPAAREGAACVCDDAGCKLAAGEACTRSDGCVSNNCIPTQVGSSVCCAAACADNEVCVPDGSACAAALPCADGNNRCSKDAYQHCTQGTWSSVAECSTLGCSREQGGCLHSAGQACGATADCGEGSCVATADGSRVCCTGGCEATCRRCAATGTSCEDTEDDAACGAIACPTEDVCRSYDPPVVTTSRCHTGRCATPEEACTAFAPQRSNAECSPTALCDDQGNCSRPKLALLASCSAGTECSSGACVATAAGGSICCSMACAPNQVCSPTGACVLAPVCTNGTTRCSGASFQRCSGSQWSTVEECGVLGCSETKQACLGGAGADCESTADCGAGTCQPTSGGFSVCCTAACSGSCRRCNVAGNACQNLTDDAACGTIQCPPDTTCRDNPVSVTSNRCVDGHCGGEELCSGVARGVGQSCSDFNLCDNAGNCSVPKRSLGDACSTAGECAQNNCVEGICCNEPCNQAQCASCSTGTCVAPPTDTRCSTGQCAGVGVCAPPSVDCGSGPACPITGAVCCSELTAGGSNRIFCEAGAEDCPAPPNFIPDIPVNCDEHDDCDPTQVCCMFGTSTSTEISCKLPNPSPDTDEQSIDFASCAPKNPMLFGDQICQNPRGQRFDCPAFEACNRTNSRLPGWLFCGPDP